MSLAVALRDACEENAMLLRRVRFDSGRLVDGWLGGGCLIAAEAFSRVVPQAKLAMIWGTFGDYTEDVLHVAAEYEGLLFDAEGAAPLPDTLEQWALADNGLSEFVMTEDDRGILDGDDDMEFWVERGASLNRVRELGIPFSEAACNRLAAAIRRKLR